MFLGRVTQRNNGDGVSQRHLFFFFALGLTSPSSFRTYTSEQWSDTQHRWIVNEQVKIDISVEEIPQGNMVVSRQGGAKGRFTFTSAESGDHSICLSPAPASWFDSTRTVC